MKQDTIFPILKITEESGLTYQRLPLYFTKVKNIVTIQNPIRKIAAWQLSFCSCGYFAI